MELLNDHGEARMDRRKDRTVEAVLEQLIETGPTDIASVFARAFELAMQIERERFLGADLYERTPERRGYANGYKAKRIDTPAGSVTVQVPKTAGHDGEPFYPQSLERGRRSVRAVMLAVAEMYVKGVSTRDAEAVMREFGIESLSSSQVSRAAKLLDEELAAWRDRPLGEIKYLILDARYEKMRHGGVVRDAAVLSAIGIGPDERRRVLGVSVALSEAEVHWRVRRGNDSLDHFLPASLLESLVARGLRGVEFIVSDDHSGLRAARRAVLGGATWQRCQFHLARNAIHHAPNAESRKRIGAELRAVWNASTLAKAEAALTELVASYRDSAPKLATWLEENVPEGLAVFTLPEHHRRRLRTSNPIERAVQQELKRRTAKVRVFPSDDSLLRLVSAILVEIDEKWASDTKAYIKWECRDA
jgi:transposase-like protein